jgi:hypothetical protein
MVVDRFDDIFPSSQLGQMFRQEAEMVNFGSRGK